MLSETWTKGKSRVGVTDMIRRMRKVVGNPVTKIKKETTGPNSLP